jgi:hypothetical protein
MTNEVCVDFALQNGWQYAGVENGDECYAANAPTRKDGAPGCTIPCAGDPSDEICGGNLQLDLYQDLAWVAPTLQAIQDALTDLLDLYDKFQKALGVWLEIAIQNTSQGSGSSSRKRDGGGGAAAASSSAMTYPPQISRQGLRLRGVLSAARRTNIINEAGYQRLDGEAADALGRTANIAGRLASYAGDAAADTAVDVVADGLATIGAPEAIAAGIAAVGLFAAWKVFDDFLHLLGSSSGTGPSASSSVAASTTVLFTFPPIPIKTVPASASATVSSAPTTFPTPLIVVFTENMDQETYNYVLADVVEGGGEIIEDTANAAVSWFAFFASLTPDQILFFYKFPLTDCLTPNVDLIQADLVDTTNGTSSSSRQGFDEVPEATTTQPVSKGSKMKRTTYPISNNIKVRTGGISQAFLTAGVRFIPFHLQWLSNLWAKSGLVGTCEQLSYLAHRCFFLIPAITWPGWLTRHSRPRRGALYISLQRPSPDRCFRARRRLPILQSPSSK